MGQAGYCNFGQIIVEILEQNEKSDAEALPYLFHDLAEVNNAADVSLLRH